MRILALITATLVTSLIFSQSKSLKIETGDQTIIYPFYLETKVLDQNNNIVYGTNDIIAEDSKTFNGDHTVKVYTHWGDGEDIFKVKEQGSISLINNDEELEPVAEEIKTLPEDHLLVVDKKFTKNNNGQYNAELAFEENIVFNYTDGQIEVTQNEISLLLIGNVVKTSEGFLIIDYNPKNKMYHYEVLKLIDEEKELSL